MFFTVAERLIAKRYIKTKRKESFITLIYWLSMLGIVIGVAVLIIVTSVMNGFKRDLIKSIVGVEGHISIKHYGGGYIDDYGPILAKLGHVKGVKGAGASISTQALLNSSNVSTGVMVKALTITDIKARHITLSNYTKNSLESFSRGEKVALIGKGLANNLGLDSSSILKLVFPKFTPTLGGSVPSYINVRVVGFFKTGMFQYDNNMVLIPLSLGQKVFSTKGTQEIELFLNNPAEAPEIQGKLGYDLPFNLYSSTWEENNVSLIGALNTERNVMFLILALIVVVATFNIMSGLVMLVRSKTKEIAILKTLGLSSKNVQNIFLLIGLRTGIIGTLVGAIIGVVVSLNLDHIKSFIEHIFHVSLFNADVYFLSKLPTEVNFAEVALIAGMSLLLSILVSIYPAKKAGKIIIAKALHYE